MRDWLLAVNDPECYIRPVDVLICTVCAAVLTPIDVCLFNFRWDEALTLSVLGGGFYLLLRFIFGIRHP
jgi:hypothetical protein